MAEIPVLLPLIVPSLTSFRVEIALSSLESGISDDILVTFLWALCSMQMPLRKLGIQLRKQLGPLLPRIHGPSHALITQSRLLTDVYIGPTHALMHALGALPCLKSLTLYMNLDHQDFGDTQEWTSPPSNTVFPVLESLGVEVNTLPQLTRFLGETRCIARRRIDVRTEEDFTSTELAAFLEVGVHPSHELVVFKLTAMSDEDVPDYNDRITFDALRPLIALPHIETFHVDGGRPLDLGDKDLRTLASAWPKIVSLDFGVWFGLYQHEFIPRITLRGLAYLAACPKLQSVTLIVEVREPEDVPPTSLDPGETSPSVLTQLDVGASFIGPEYTSVVKEFLKKRFPKLRDLSWETTDENFTGFDQDVSGRWHEIWDSLRS